MKSIIVSSIYTPFWGTEQFERSLKRLGLDYYNAFTDHYFKGNGSATYQIYRAYLDLKDEFTHAIYSDGADTFWVKKMTPPDDHILYSAEKACYPWPHL